MQPGGVNEQRELGWRLGVRVTEKATGTGTIEKLGSIVKTCSKG
jgi:hypothetical protein